MESTGSRKDLGQMIEALVIGVSAFTVGRVCRGAGMLQDYGQKKWTSCLSLSLQFSEGTACFTGFLRLSSLTLEVMLMASGRCC